MGSAAALALNRPGERGAGVHYDFTAPSTESETNNNTLEEGSRPCSLDLIFRVSLLLLGFRSISPQAHDHAHRARDNHHP